MRCCILICSHHLGKITGVLNFTFNKFFNLVYPHNHINRQQLSASHITFDLWLLFKQRSFFFTLPRNCGKVTSGLLFLSVALKEATFYTWSWQILPLFMNIVNKEAISLDSTFLIIPLPWQHNHGNVTSGLWQLSRRKQQMQQQKTSSPL